MIKTIFKYYNQNLERYTRNGCSLYTLFTIIQVQRGIKVDNEFIIKALQQAEQTKVFGESWGAYFAKIYNWFTVKILERTGVKIKVVTVDIRSKEFKILYSKGYAFGLGLKFSGMWYRHAREDGIITEQEAKDADLSIYKEAGHNHTYYKGMIIDTLGSISGKVIKMDLEALRKAVDKGLYYPTTRTLVMEDRLLEKYLKKYQLGEVVENVENLPTDHIKAIEKASSLRIFKK